MLIARFANPGRFTRLAEPLLPLCAGGMVVSFAFGIYYALFASPPDYQQGETVRIMYVHVPAAWMGLLIYMAMALAAAVGFVSRHILADIFCKAAAPIGATFTGLCLATGSIWGKPTWGAWWVWDARLTSVLILFLLYCGVIALRDAFEDEAKGARASAVLLIAGAVNIPIVRFSVDWWHTLHQPASVLRIGGSTIAPQMLKPLFIMAMAYTFYAVFVIVLRMRSELLRRKTVSAKSLD